MTTRTRTETAEDAPPTVTRRRGHPLAVSLAGLYALVTVAVLLTWWTVGDVWWAQPLNVTTFWWTLPAIPLVAVSLAGRRWRAAVFLAVPALTFVWSYGGQFVPNGAPGPADLRVATYNTYVNAPDVEHVVALVEDQRPDVLLLQEVFPERGERLRAALSDWYGDHAWIGQDARVGSVAVFSRFPVLEVRPIRPPSTHSRPTAVVVLDVGGQPVQVVALHLISPCRDCGPVSDRLELEGEVRRAEVDAVLAALDADVPAIVGGDLNSNDRSEPYRALVEHGFEDPQSAVGQGPGFTWPANRRTGPWLRIDWVLVRGFEAVRSYVADAGPSDHRPVVVDLALEA